MDALMMAAPNRTFRQRMDALERANKIRSYRAQLKKDVKAGRTNAVLLLLSDDPLLDTWRVSDLVRAVPKVGDWKARKILERARVSPSKTLGGLTERQRSEVAALLTGTIQQ